MNKFMNNISRETLKQEKKQSRGRVVIIIIAAIVAIICLTVATVSIKNITVTGNAWYSDEEIIDYLFNNKADYNSAYCYYKSSFKEHEAIPFVQDYKIVFQNPMDIEIIVYEKSVVGYVSYMSSYMYFDKDGIVVESTNDKLPGVPWITGLKFGQIVLYKPLPIDNSKIFNEILNLTQILSIYNIYVDEIKYDNNGDAVLVMDNIDVVLGNSGDTNGKISELNDILPQLEGLSGTLYLDTYDISNSSGTYTFKRK